MCLSQPSSATEYTCEFLTSLIMTTTNDGQSGDHPSLGLYTNAQPKCSSLVTAASPHRSNALDVQKHRRHNKLPFQLRFTLNCIGIPLAIRCTIFSSSQRWLSPAFSHQLVRYSLSSPTSRLLSHWLRPLFAMQHTCCDSSFLDATIQSALALILVD